MRENGPASASLSEVGAGFAPDDLRRSSEGNAFNLESGNLSPSIRAAKSSGALANAHLIAAVSSLYIAADVIFVAGLQPLAAALTGAGCFFSLLFVWRGAPDLRGAFIDGPIDWRLLAASLAAVCALAVLAGGGHFFYANPDWLIRDAVLGDLSRHPFPLAYRHEGGDLILRAPLGMYLLPATVGRLTGLFGAHFALLVQNVILLGASVYVIASLAPRWRAFAIFLFLFFSGVEIIPQIKMIMAGSAKGLWPPCDIEWWTLYFQYSSNVTEIFWAPNHAAPGWWLASLVLLAARREYDLARLGVMTAAMLLWSPLAVVTAPVFLLSIAARDHFRDFRSMRLWLAMAAAALFLPVVVFLMIGADRVPTSGFLLGKPGFIAVYLSFLTIQIPHAYIIYKAWPAVDEKLRNLVVVAVGLLCVIPLYSFGPGNDLAMRGSIQPLVILAYAFVSVVASVDWRTRPGLGAATALIVAGGAMTPLFAIAGGLYYRPYAISVCDLLTASHQIDGEGLPDNYVAPRARAPDWIVHPGMPVEPVTAGGRDCWPDHPLPEWTHPGPKL